MSSPTLNTPLSDDEYATLDVLLGAPELGGRAMDVSALEGFLTALVIGPNLVAPEQWLPRVWNKEGQADIPVQPFASAADGELAASLVMRHYQHMLTWMTEEPNSFEPIYDCGPEWSAAQWCRGFLLGGRIDAAPWTALSVSQPVLLAPFLGLGGAHGQETATSEDETEHWMSQVAPAVIQINALWLKQRRNGARLAAADGAQVPVMREMAKVGRNDPCHCGSGKKYKKCCADGDGAI